MERFIDLDEIVLWVLACRGCCWLVLWNASPSRDWAYRSTSASKLLSVSKRQCNASAEHHPDHGGAVGRSAGGRQTGWRDSYREPADYDRSARGLFLHPELGEKTVAAVVRSGETTVVAADPDPPERHLPMSVQRRLCAIGSPGRRDECGRVLSVDSGLGGLRNGSRRLVPAPGGFDSPSTPFAREGAAQG